MLIPDGQQVTTFVCSTYSDLSEYRNAARKTLEDLDYIVKGMEKYGARPESALETCRNEVKASHIFIGIIGTRYGTIPADYDKSMTHLEYEAAREAELTCLIYLLDEDEIFVRPRHVDCDRMRDKLVDF